MRVGEPEVEGDDCGLDEQPSDQERERRDHEPVRLVPRERMPDLGKVERTGAGVQQAGPEEDAERPDAVGDREVDRALERACLLDPVTGERVRRHAHQLEPDEHVEEVA